MEEVEDDPLVMVISRAGDGTRSVKSKPRRGRGIGKEWKDESKVKKDAEGKEEKKRAEIRVMKPSQTIEVIAAVIERTKENKELKNEQKEKRRRVNSFPEGRFVRLYFWNQSRTEALVLCVY